MPTNAFATKPPKVKLSAGGAEFAADFFSAGARLMGRLDSLHLHFALLLQGDSEAELPERILAAAALRRVDLRTGAEKKDRDGGLGRKAKGGTAIGEPTFLANPQGFSKWIQWKSAEEDGERKDWEESSCGICR